MTRLAFFAILALVTSFFPRAMAENSDTTDTELEEITLAAGCFWCVEAVFEQLDGVKSAVSGYMGGHLKNPSYREVCTGRTGHAEVIKLTFNPSVVTVEQILDLFWISHDPTTLNRQGADVGTQYRSAIFYHSEEQREIAERSLADKDASGAFQDAIVTEIAKASVFYPAEDYHQSFYELNKTHPYCQAVITPKLEKLQQKSH